MMDRVIVHLDMDAFFAAVEERDKSYLRGLPVVIGADPKGGAGRGVVSTANYAARAYGIKSAMPIGMAWRLCEAEHKAGKPACAFLTGRHGVYAAASETVFAIARQYASVVEQTSIDEGYLDFSHYQTFARAKKAASDMKKQIKKELSLTASVGIAPNKLVAKIASDAQKPDGLTIVRTEEIESFLDPFPVRSIPGIGPKATSLLAARGIKTVKDAKRLSWDELEDLFGKWGFGMYERVRGIDERPVEAESDARKSIGKHHTFDVDTRDMKEVTAILDEQARRIIRRMHREGFKGFRTTVLTVRFDDFSTRTRSLTVPETLATVEALEMKAMKLALPFFDTRENPKKKAIRLIGLRVEKLAE